MSEREYRCMTPRSFINKLEGFETERNKYYDLIRLQTFEIFNLSVDKKYRKRKPEDLWRFAHDKTEINRPDVNYVDKFTKRLERVEKRHGHSSR